MDILKFTLTGKTAFFKKPEVNTYCYFTYGCIHKVVLLGMFGAIMGYDGYAQQIDKKSKWPEFYEKLQDLKVSIIPICENGFVPKKIQTYNNSVGYASFEQGGNLIVKEQWLENPKWEIFISIDSKEAEVLADMLLHKKCIYVPYLGKNDHIADIYDVKICQSRETKEYHSIHSLFLKKNVSYQSEADYMEESGDITVYKYEEYLPVGLDETMNLYMKEEFVQTNNPIKSYADMVYEVEGKNIVFF